MTCQDLPLIIVLNSFTRKMFGLRLKTLIVFPCVSVLPRLWFSLRLRRPVVFAAPTAVKFKNDWRQTVWALWGSLSQANPKFQSINNAHDCTTCKLVHESILDWDHLWLLKPGMTAVIELSILRRHWNGNSLLKTGLVDNLVKLNNVKNWLQLAQLQPSPGFNSKLASSYMDVFPYLCVADGSRVT